MSYIKEKEPQKYQFFLEFWNLVKKYWKTENSEEWWDAFISDMTYYTAKYDRDDFCIDLLMELYENAKRKEERLIDIQEASNFLAVWWEYINKYYIEEKTVEWWQAFTNETNALLERYSDSLFCCNIIEIFYKTKAHSEESIAV